MHSRSSGIRFFLLFSIILMAANLSAQTTMFSGRVYEGNVWVQTKPIKNVTVKLYGSGNGSVLGTEIGSTTTDQNGWFGLQIPGGYEFYTIKETNPSGYNSVTAKSVDGDVLGPDRIQYSTASKPISEQTLTGNKFWDKKPVTNNNPPVADADGPYTTQVGKPTQLDGSGSYDPDTGDKIVTYQWYWKAQGSYTPINGPMTTPKIYWVPPIAGQLTVKLKVTDKHGAKDTDTAPVIVNALTSVQDDYGDAPASYLGTSSMYLAVTQDFHLGTLIDGESSAQPHPNALGDDNDGQDDEDGVTFHTQLIPGQQSSVILDLTGIDTLTYDDWMLVAYLDLDINGTWEAQEKIIDLESYELKGGGIDTVSFSVPANASIGITYASFELIYGGPEPPHGYPWGEVEDYEVTIVSGEDLDYGDAPSGYPDAWHDLGGPWLGSIPPDADTGTQSDPQALGDDNDGTDDEDVFTVKNGYIVKGKPFEFTWICPPTMQGTVTLGLWIDLDMNGSWDEFPFIVSFDGSQHQTIVFGGTLSGSVPTGLLGVRTRAYSSQWAQQTLTPGGYGGPGEVEDHFVEVRAEGVSPPEGRIISGHKWFDQNGNGKWDAAESPLAGWTIWLDTDQDGVKEMTDDYTQTDGTGQYTFYVAADGTYLVGEELTTGWTQTFPGGAGTHMATVQQGQVSTGYDFGNMDIEHGDGQGALKWSQPPVPDFQSETPSFRGWSEPSVYSVLLIADDWFCYDPQPVTSVRWWGSYAGWNSESPPQKAPSWFHIGIWSDIPAGHENDSSFSHPGTLEREWIVERSMVDEVLTEPFRMREWMELPDSCFQYTFSIPPAEWFYQEDDSTVYWLSVSAMYEEIPEEHIWGWITRDRYFNDEAVRIYEPSMVHPDSLYRIGEPLPEGWDMAFELGTDLHTANFDYGDAPIDIGGTVKLANGACHLLRNDLLLGALVDIDEDGQPAIDAAGDDQDGFDDEDGIEFMGEAVQGELALAAVTVSAPGFLNAWLDMNDNGEWESFEQIFRQMELDAGIHVLEFPVFDETEPGEKVVRFRFSSWPHIGPKGFAPDGEVEDHIIDVQPSTDVGFSSDLPGRNMLHPNYPNPFNPETTIAYEIGTPGHVRLLIFDMLGRQVAELVNDRQKPGQYMIRWNGRDREGRSVTSGMYIVVLESGSFRKTGKLLLVR